MRIADRKGPRRIKQSASCITLRENAGRTFTVRLCLVLVMLAPASAQAQVDGHVSVLFDMLPNLGDACSAQASACATAAVMELRTRVFLERKQDLGAHLRLNLSGYVDGLVADRKASGGSGTSSDAVVRPNDLYAELVSTRFDLRVGASRIVWGRLDEFQPTDVVNPIDLTRFLLEGRSEARLPVGLVRGRVFLPRSSTLEGIVVPVFRAGRFDQLEERTSPFNLAAGAEVVCPPFGLGSASAELRRDRPCRLLVRDRREPDAAWRNVQGGARFMSTAGRVDWAVSAFRGFRAFPAYTITLPRLIESFPRFTMIGGDFETVRGAWGIRGEAAAFVEDAGREGPRRMDRVESGIGVDRRAGDYRVSANVLLTHQRIDGNDVTLIGSVDRRFARETRTVRLFAVYDPTDDTAFVRGIAAVSLRDDVWIEGSAGVFAGSSLDTLGRLTRRDFVYTRLKVFF